MHNAQIKKTKQKQQTLIFYQVANWIYEDDTDWREEHMYTHIKEVFKKHRKIKQMKM